MPARFFDDLMNTPTGWRCGHDRLIRRRGDPEWSFVAVLVVNPDGRSYLCQPSCGAVFSVEHFEFTVRAADLVLPDNPLLSLISKARVQDSVIREFGFRLFYAAFGHPKVRWSIVRRLAAIPVIWFSVSKSMRQRVRRYPAASRFRAVPSGHGGNARA